MKKYVLLIFLFGMIYIFITPPFQVPDARNHFHRASQVADGQFIAEKKEHHTGGNVPKNIAVVSRHFSYMSFDPDAKTSVEYILKAFGVKLNFFDKSYHGFENTSLFSPVPYLPAALAIRLTTLISNSVLLTYYAAGITTLLASVMIIALAMHYLPIYRPLVFAFSILPMFLFQLASISADSISNAMAILFVCQLFSVIHYQKRVGWKVFLPILVTSLLLALCKQTHVVLLLGMLLISPRYFDSLREYYKYALIFIVTITVVVVSWNTVAKGIYTPWNAKTGTDAEKQLLWVIGHPLLFLKISTDDLLRHGLDYMLTMGGAKLGWFDTDIPAKIIGFHLALLSVIAAFTYPKAKLSIWQHVLCGCIIITGIYLIELSIYFHAETVGSMQIRGIHGRYFLFLFFLFLAQLALININRVNSGNVLKILTKISTIPFFVSIPILIYRYYVQ